MIASLMLYSRQEHRGVPVLLVLIILKRAISRPVIAVERAVLDCFRNMHGTDGFSAVEVGDGAGDFQDAIVGARGKPQASHGALEQAVAIGREAAVFPDLSWAHLRVAIDLLAFEALQLPLAGAHDTLTNLLRAFAARTLPQLAVLHRRHVNVDVDAIEQRA